MFDVFDVRAGVSVAAALSLVFSAGCGSNSAVQKQDKSYTVEEAKDQFQKDLEKNLAEIDADSKLSASQKEANKKMMRETFKRRLETYDKQD